MAESKPEKEKKEKPVEKHKKAEAGKKVEAAQKIEHAKESKPKLSVEEKTLDEGKIVEEIKTTIKGKKKRKGLKVPKGIAHIKSTFNNTLVTISDLHGNTVVSSSSGAIGFKGSKKSTPFAASRAADIAGKKALAFGMKEISVYVKGPGAGREAAIRSLESAGLAIMLIRDVTPIPHNGCRPPKRRRV